LRSSPHSWDANATDATLASIAEFAAQEGLEVWCTEAGWDPFLWQRPDEFPTWKNAIRLATIYSRMLKLSRISVILYWEMMGKDYYLNDGSLTFPSFEILRQLGENLPAGTRIVWTSPDSGGVYSFAAAADDHFVLYLVNSNPQPAAVQVNGLPAGTYRHIQSTEQEMGKVLGSIPVVTGPNLVTLPASCANLLVLPINP
jgi:hypothetical protein